MSNRFSEVSSQPNDKTKDGAQNSSDGSRLNLVSLAGERSQTGSPTKISGLSQENSQAAVTAHGFPNLDITGISNNDTSSNTSGGFWGGIESAIKSGAEHVGSIVKAGVDYTTPVGLIDHFAGTNIGGAIGDMAQGFANEVVNDPKTLLKDAAIGAAIGVATVATGGGLEVGLAIGAGVMAASELYKNSGNGIGGEVNGAVGDAVGVGNSVVQFGKDVDTVVENKYPTTLAAQHAQQGLQNAGAFMAQTAAFAVGGAAGSQLAGAFGRMAASSMDSSASALKGDGSGQAETLTPEQQALQNSITKNQSLFNDAAKDGGVVPNEKQLYNVRFNKVTEPTEVASIEATKAGTTELAKPGQWIATRLNDDGTPNIENGVQNSWPVTEKTILKTYETTPEQLASSNEVVAPTKVGGQPVHMIKLDQPLAIKTSWAARAAKPVPTSPITTTTR